jgi:type I restriction enzyme, S subunit
MKHDLKPYQAYKDSGVPWLGSVPAHWNIRRAKWLFRKMDRTIRGDDEVVTCFRDGIVTLRKHRRVRGFTESLKEIGYQGVRRGDLVVHAMDAFAGAVGVSDSDGKCSPVYSICQPTAGTNAEYYAYIVREMARSQWIAALAKGIRERSTDFRFDGFANQSVPLPPLAEQSAMVRFLDHVDRRIRRYIRAKQKLIALLNEQKQAIIHTAVTRGLDPGVHLKPSGVDWLGDIPDHWEIRRIKSVCSAIIDCKNRTPKAVDTGLYTVVRTTCIRNAHFDLEGSYHTDETQYRIWTARGAPRIGDVFFTREAPAGEACMVPDRRDLCMGQRMMYFRPDPALLDARFLLLNIYGPLVRRYVELATNGSTVGHLRLGQVYALPITWCLIEEQRVIVVRVLKTTAELEGAIDRTMGHITLMREYRTRLIADVVTGKLDVREAAAHLPEDAEEPEPLDQINALTDGDEEIVVVELNTASEKTLDG